MKMNAFNADVAVAAVGDEIQFHHIELIWQATGERRIRNVSQNKSREQKMALDIIIHCWGE